MTSKPSTCSAIAKEADAIVGTTSKDEATPGGRAALAAAPVANTTTNASKDSTSHKNDETTTVSKEAKEEEDNASSASQAPKSQLNGKQASTKSSTTTGAPSGSSGVINNSTTKVSARKSAHVAITAPTARDEEEDETTKTELTADDSTTTTLQDTAATTILRGLQHQEEEGDSSKALAAEKEDPKKKQKSPRNNNKRAATKTALIPRTNKRVKTETNNSEASNNNKTDTNKSPTAKPKILKPALPTQKKVAGPRKGKGGPGSCGDGRWANKGASKRESYSTAFKAKAVRDFEAWEEAQKELPSNKNKSPTVRQYVAEHNLGQKYLKFLSPKSGWRRPDVRQRIVSDAATSEFKESTRLTNRDVNKSYFAEMEENLVRRIEEYRERSITVSTNTIRALAKEEWLKLNIEEIEKKKSFDYEREMNDDDDPRKKGPPTEFKASNGWLFNFLKRQNRKTKKGVLQERANLSSTKNDPLSGSKQKFTNENEEEAVGAVLVDDAAIKTTTATDPATITFTDPPVAVAAAATVGAVAEEGIQIGNPNETKLPAIVIDPTAPVVGETTADQQRHDALVAATTTVAAAAAAETDERHDDDKIQGDAARVQTFAI